MIRPLSLQLALCARTAWITGAIFMKFGRAPATRRSFRGMGSEELGVRSGKCSEERTVAVSL
jgi:hypothetical protein